MPSLEQIGLPLMLVGALVTFLGFLRLVRVAIATGRPWGRKSWLPLLFLLLGVGIAASPFAINWVMKTYFPEGPRERVVAGETHVTLTGVADYDYAGLAKKTEIQVLQMANADVTDDTLRHLKDMSVLKELDLNDTQITDAGLARIAELPALEKLRLRNTKITDAGFREYLLGRDRLDELDLTGTAVTGKTVRVWKAAKAGRKALN